jgi:hypothetical protein
MNKTVCAILIPQQRTETSLCYVSEAQLMAFTLFQ